MKYYYEDAFSAAWMHHAFGMKFVTDEGDLLEWCSEFSCFHIPDKNELSQAWDGTYFIHPDSLYLLNPQEGDLAVSFDCRNFPVYGIVAGSGEIVAAESNCAYNSYGHGFTEGLSEIYARSSKPFHWPEREQ